MEFIEKINLKMYDQKQRIMVLILHNFCSIKKKDVKSYSISWIYVITYPSF